MISNLPMELLNKIFEYDGTYREKYNEVMAEIKFLKEDPSVVGFSSDNDEFLSDNQWFMVLRHRFYFIENEWTERVALDGNPWDLGLID